MSNKQGCFLFFVVVVVVVVVVARDLLLKMKASWLSHLSRLLG